MVTDQAIREIIKRATNSSLHGSNKLFQENSTPKFGANKRPVLQFRTKTKSLIVEGNHHFPCESRRPKSVPAPFHKLPVISEVPDADPENPAEVIKTQRRQIQNASWYCGQMGSSDEAAKLVNIAEDFLVQENSQ